MITKTLVAATIATLMVAIFGSGTASAGTQNLMGQDLRLVPYPRQVRRVDRGTFQLKPIRLILTVNSLSGTSLDRAATELRQDIISSGATACSYHNGQSPKAPHRFQLTLTFGKLAIYQQSAPTQAESYSLKATPHGITLTAGTEIGMLHGISTLRQLVRANLHNNSIPCVEITDWPSLTYRGFLDDITRGPSPSLKQLEWEADFASYLRMNCFTCYLEHQFAFRKHPEIGPKDGSLTPEELRTLNAYSVQHGVELIGCQQSFGHLDTVLNHPQFAGLRETPDLISPAVEGSYKLLDDLYSEEAPLLSSKNFLVCCDEVSGLGDGPAKSLVARIGVGGTYAQHLARIHDLTTGKYGKRMMMWGDIILQHPENLRDIPKNTILLTWGYSAETSFDHQIQPFKQAGLDFIVCPGVSNWSRILPDFTTSATNIHNFVRDGIKSGTLGVLNTTWNDDGETLFGPDVYGLAYGAECAWNGSTTSIDQFNRRIGAVLFGEQGDHFGRAIELLGKTHGLSGYRAMMDSRFWDVEEGKLPGTRETSVAQAEALLTIINPALRELKSARADAHYNQSVLDTYLFGAARMRFMAMRQLEYLRSADSYSAAAASSNSATQVAGIESARQRVIELMHGYMELKAEYTRLWHIEKRPYALANVLARYDAAIARFSTVAVHLKDAEAIALRGQPMPTAESVGLDIVELGARNVRPATVLKDSLLPASRWSFGSYPFRMGLSITVRSPRVDQPVEIELPGKLANGAQLVELTSTAEVSTPCQIVSNRGRSRLVFMAAATATATATATAKREYMLYFRADAGSSSIPTSTQFPTMVSKQNDGYWIDNGRLKLFIGAEGGHIFRWEDRELNGRNLTQPGGHDWQGFADIIGPSRSAINRIEVLEEGPVRSRLRCSDTQGVVKTFDIWAGMPWLECTLRSGTDWFSCYDDASVMGADSPTPGRFLFQDGTTGALKPLTNTPDCQIKRDSQHWAAKYVPGGAAIGLITPEVSCRHCVGPGGGMGAVFTEGAPEPSHFVIYGGRIRGSVQTTMEQLRAALDFSNPSLVTLYGTETRKAH